jgi:pSer/pThr/pTyr-binding forkhead associated (FHA) protein
VIVVEVLDRRGRVAERTRVTQLPAVLGRGYDCAVVLDDPHVEARHVELQLDEAGGIVVQDLGTVNGTWRAGSGEPGTGSGAIALGAGGLIRVGATLVRLRTPAAPVPQARPLAVHRGWIAALERPRTALAVTGAALAVVFAGLWLGDTSANGLAQVTSTGLELVVVVALWAGVWAFAGRLNVHRPAYLAHTAVTLVALVALGVAGTVAAYVDVILDATRVVGVLIQLAATVIGVGLVAMQLALATLQPPRTRLLRAVLVVAVVWGLSELLARADQDGMAYVETGLPLRPVPARLVVAPDADHLLRETASLQRTLDALATSDTER